MINHNLIQALVFEAQKSHRTQSSPDAFAMKSAVMITSEIAFKESPEASLAATFVAALSFQTLSGYSAKWILSDLQKTNKQNIKDWDSLANQANNQTVLEAANTLFLQTFNGPSIEKHQKALMIAKTHFTFVFAHAFSAYCYAHAVAARASKHHTNEVFKQAINERLSQTLLNKPIEPGFLMKALTSDKALYLSVLGVTGGIVAFSIGVSLLAIPAFGVALTSLAGIGSIGLAATGALSAAAGSSLLPSRFFAKTYQSYQDRKSDEAVNALLSEESENHTALQVV